MRIFHVALLSDWEAAKRAGSYTTSTLGRTLAEEGYIHASRGDQWPGVRERFYSDVTEPLVLLVIETDRLTSPVVEEPPPGATETFPHVYGPINAEAVVQVVPLDARGAALGESFSRLFLHEMFRNVAISMLVLLATMTGALTGRALDPQWGALSGATIGFVIGLAAGLAVARRWR